MEDLYEARNSIYCYSGTNVLINKLNIRNTKDLLYYEAKITAAKLLDLRQRGITGNFDMQHFVAIHSYLFEDIYSFAGKFRNENIAKDHFRFAEWEYIDIELDRILKELKEENFLLFCSRRTIAKKLAYYMAELNVLHPFREGNGRTIREFIRQIALKNGYRLDLRKENPAQVLQACIESVANTNSLEQIIDRSLEKIEINID